MKRAGLVGLLVGLIVTMIGVLAGEAQAQDWPMWRHDGAHTGFVQTEIMLSLERKPILLGNDEAYSQPVVVDNIAYIGIQNGVVAIDLKTGLRKWTAKIGREIWSVSVIGNKLLGVSGRGSDTRMDFIILDRQTGQNESIMALSASRPSDIAVEKGVAYVSTNKGIYAVDVIRKRLKWHNEELQDSGALTVAGGKVFLSAGQLGIYAYNATSGDQLWQFVHSDMFRYGSAVSNGIVYVGTTRGEKIYALDAETGDIRWETKVSNAVYSVPAIAHGMVFAGLFGGKVVALDARTGRIRWESKVCPDIGPGDYIDFFSPIVAGDLVIIASADYHKLYGLDAKTGEKKFELKTKDVGPYSCQAAAGKIFVCGDMYVPKDEIENTPKLEVVGRDTCRHNMQKMIATLMTYREEYHKYPRDLTEGVKDWYYESSVAAQRMCPVVFKPYVFSPTTKKGGSEIILKCYCHPGYLIKAFQDGRVFQEKITKK